ncbi:HAD hydrolase-like protein, partial [Streptomyces sp. NPDC058255]|uniref:HAD hydrolase-like protein n=1 Tax=Streptomyces sp. NPDC058255 TaxID=3346407 RepID=UPI0036E587DF
MSTLGGIAVIFDLDGTLVDSEPNYFEAGRQTLAEQGITDFTWSDHEGYVGISTQETLALLQERYGLAVPRDSLRAAPNRREVGQARAGPPVYAAMGEVVER